VEGGCTLGGCEKIIARVADIGEFLFAAISRNPKKWPCDDVMGACGRGEMIKYGKRLHNLFVLQFRLCETYCINGVSETKGWQSKLW
jgi:hypothetical protein